MGVARDATEAQIKQAYRKLARKCHPDVSKEKDAEARFKEVQEAYEVLKDPTKRAAYDQLGANWKQGEQFRPPPDFGANFDFSQARRGRAYSAGHAGAGGAGHDFEGNEQFSDFFSSLFGGAAPGFGGAAG